MPRYELCVILKAMQRPETASVLKRTLQTLLERGSIIRGLENLGERTLPYNMSKHDCRHTHGRYFSIDFHSTPTSISAVLEHLERDVDVLRPTVVKKRDVPRAQVCSLSQTSHH